jgi:hypothetical protein
MTGAIAETLETEEADAGGPDRLTTAAADPVVKMAISMRILPAGVTATVSAKIVTRAATVAAPIGAIESGSATEAAEVAARTMTGGTVVKSEIWPMIVVDLGVTGTLKGSVRLGGAHHPHPRNENPHPTSPTSYLSWSGGAV